MMPDGLCPAPEDKTPRGPAPNGRAPSGCADQLPVSGSTGMIVALTVATFSGCRRDDVSDPPGEVFDAGAVFASSTPRLSHGFRVVNHSSRLMASAPRATPVTAPALTCRSVNCDRASRSH